MLAVLVAGDGSKHAGAVFDIDIGDVDALTAPLASTLVAGDLAEGVTAINERHDEVHVIGSLDLVQSLLRLGLVDRLSLWG